MVSITTRDAPCVCTYTKSARHLPHGLPTLATWASAKVGTAANSRSKAISHPLQGLTRSSGGAAADLTLLVFYDSEGVNDCVDSFFVNWGFATESDNSLQSG